MSAAQRIMRRISASPNAPPRRRPYTAQAPMSPHMAPDAPTLPPACESSSGCIE